MTLPIADPVLIFAVVMAILFLAPLLFERLRVPGLVGLIVAGAAVGPSAAGLLERDATFELLGTVGLLYLMFVAGLGLDLNEFRRARTKSLVFGLLSFGLPMALSLAAGRFVLGFGWPATLLLGSIVGSHTLLAYPLAARLGITRNPLVVAATGGTLVTDLISLLVLAVVAASVQGATGMGFWLRFGGFTAVWAAAVLLLLPRLGRWFMRSGRHQAEVTFTFLMFALFTSAWLAGAVGLAPIIGAFLAGLALNSLIPPTSPLMTRIQFVGDALLIPFFLVSVGLLVDVRVLVSSLEVWWLALVFTVLVIVGKGGAALITQRIYGHSNTEGLAVAGLTIPQAAATLAVTLVGFEIGLFRSADVNAVVVMILLSCLLGPMLVRRYGQRLALAESDKPYEPASAPQRILIPLANPETAEELVELALLLRNAQSDEAIYPLAVARGGPTEAADVASGEKLLERALVHAAAADVPCTPITRIDVNAASGIVRAVRERRISTVVIGWNGQNTARALVFGSVLDQLLEETRELVVVSRLVHPVNLSRRTVLIVPPHAHLETGFAMAARTLKILAARNGHTLHVVAVADEADEVQRRLAQTRPEADLRLVPLPAWGELMRTLNGLVVQDDLVVLLSVREGALAWRPALNRLPRVLTARFAANDVLIPYLSEVEADALAATAQTTANGSAASDGATASLVPDLPLEHVVLGLPAGPPETVLERLLGGAAPGVFADGEAARLASPLAESAGGYAPELRPGVVFYHLQSASVAAPHVFAGTSADGLRLPNTGGSAYVVLALLAPEAMPQDEYLRQLAVTARLVRDEATVEALRAATSPEEVHRVLVGGLRPVAAESA